MNLHDLLPMTAFENAGLNLIAVFPLSSLPEKTLSKLTTAGYDLSIYKQLILIAHAGTAFWQALTQNHPQLLDENANPVDTYTRNTVDTFFKETLQTRRYDILYPGRLPLDLQALGTQAGWHHPSPFWVGVNNRYGSWFAYRALILADSNFAPTTPWAEPSPCTSCATQPCISACPAQALQDGQLNLERCLNHRRQPESSCRYQCLARNACPVGSEHRYDATQMQHHYAASLKFIEAPR